MSHHRIFQPALSIDVMKEGDRITVADPEARHAIRVKRLRRGDYVELLAGHGIHGVGRVTEIGKTSLVIEMESIDQEVRPSPRITVAAPPPKGSRADLMVEQLSQLGASRWIPLVTQRSVADPKPGRIEKWRRGAIESAKQCGRTWFLEIEEPVTLERLFVDVQAPILLADVGADGYRDPGVEEFLVLVGPEGGFTDDEAEAIFRAGATPIGLSPFTLRIETAVAASVAAAFASRPLGNPEMSADGRR